MVYKFFNKKSSGRAIKPEPNYQLSNELHRQIIRKLSAEPNYQLSNELHRQIIRKFKRGNVYSSFRENIWQNI